MEAITSTGTSTTTKPSENSTSPVPLTPTAFHIGKAFIKQYYEVLATKPENIPRFYKPDSSTVSHSFLPSVPADPKTLTGDSAADFFQWASCNGAGICVDFGTGAIDAQETVNGGILLVVTGQMTLPNESQAKPFVHTFFLNNANPPGRRKNYYVHNDILRFISAVSNVDADDQQQAVPSEDSAAQVLPPPPQDKPLMSLTSKMKGIPALENSDQKEEKVMDKSTTDASTKKDETTSSTTVINAERPQQAQPEPSTNSKEASSSSQDTDVTSAKKSNTKKEESASDVSATSKPNNSTDKKKANSESSSVVATSNDASTSTKDEKKSSKKSKARSRSRKKGRNDGSRSSSPLDKTDGTNNSGSSKNGKSKRNSNNGDASSSTKPKPPGSWASLVAGTSSGSKPSAASASSATETTDSSSSSKRGVEKETKESSSATVGASETSTSTATKDTKSSSQQQQQQQPQLPKHSTNTPTSVPQRTPEATLFLKNIPDKAKESEIRSMFEPYAIAVNQKVLGITLKASNGFCFVDFDAKHVVDTILKEVEQYKANRKQQQSEGGGSVTDGNKFVLHGKMLDVGRKVPVDKSGGGGRSFRSSSPGNSAFPKSRSHHRRNSPRGGNRSGRQQGNQDKK